MTGGDDERDVTEERKRSSVYALAVIVVFAAQPFAAFYQAHESQLLEPGRLALYAFVTVAVALAVWAALVRFARLPAAPTALAVVAVVVSFFAFSWWLSPDPRGATRWVQLLLWIAVTAAAAFLAYRFARFPAFRTAVLVFGVAFLAVPAIAVVVSSSASPAVEADAALAPLRLDDLQGPPNVYWFMVDSYAREDQLEDILELDNRDFTDALEDRGFEVSSSSMGSYAHTHLSLSSTLAMDYLVEPGNDLDDPFGELGPVVRGDNETVRRFHDLGYQYIYSPQGWLPWAACDDDYVDVCLPPRRAALGTTEVELALLDLTPLGSLDLVGLPYTDPVYVLDELDAHASEIDEPFFLFAHVNTPHWPYRYDEDCGARRQPLDAQELTLEERMAGYTQDLECLNPLLLEAVDRIEADDPSAVVIIQSDHGSDFYSNWHVGPDGWNSAALNEHFSVLNAIRLPDVCEGRSLEGEPLVNTFRVVFGCIEGPEHELLPWRAFLSPLDQPEQIEELDPDRFEPGTPAPAEEGS